MVVQYLNLYNTTELSTWKWLNGKLFNVYFIRILGGKKRKENGHQSQALYKVCGIPSCLDLQSSFRRCQVGYEEKEEYEQKDVSKHHGSHLLPPTNKEIQTHGAYRVTGKQIATQYIGKYLSFNKLNNNKMAFRTLAISEFFFWGMLQRQESWSSSWFDHSSSFFLTVDS